MSLDNEEDWMRCTDWLVRCGMISEQQKNTISSVEHLASILKDGVLLCNLLNFVNPGCISACDFSLRPQASYFLCQKNIKTFLRVCKTSFGLKDKNLFDPVELLFLQDFKNVIHTLSVLSQTKEMKRRKIDSFVADSDAEYILMQDIVDECEDEYSSSMYGFQAEKDIIDNEDIYDSLVSMQQKNKEVKKTRKEYCLDELCDTEKNFLEVIDLINKHFMKPLKSHLNEEEFAIIFDRIEDLKQVHMTFYTSLLQAKTSANPVTNTSRCFIDCRFSFVIYGDYCSKLHLCHLEIKRILQIDQVFSDIIEEGYNKAKVKLQDLLIIPSQRILKYHLLIRELIKNCQDRPDEVIELKKSLETMEDLGVYINEVKRDYENINNIHEIENNIRDIKSYCTKPQVKLERSGRLHFDGCFKIKEATEPRYDKWYLFLFDKLLLICEPYKKVFLQRLLHKNTQQTDQYSYKGSIAMQDCVFEQAADTDKKIVPIVITSVRDPSLEYHISSDRAESLTKLMNYLNIAKDNTRPPGCSTDIVLCNFIEPTECTVCHKLLRGLLSQGYHCKKTGACLHKECLPKILNKKENQEVKKTVIRKKETTSGVSNSHIIQGPAKMKHHFNHLEVNWFSTAENRNEASNFLRNSPLGTFLVRWSEDKSAYVVSIKTDKVRHMEVKKDHTKYFLKSGTTFETIPLLVDYYRTTSLVEAFSAVDSPLLQPLNDVTQEKCRALYDFSATGVRQLTFKEGDVIEIVSKNAGGGWWRGRLNGKKGNFPSNYVELVD